MRLGHVTWLLVELSVRVGSSLLSVLVAHIVVLESSSSVQLIHDELNDLENLRLVEEISREASDVLFFMVLEISLVSVFFLLNLSYFLKFVMVDVESLSIEWLLGD